jgi:hypothetical protein
MELPCHSGQMRQLINSVSLQSVTPQTEGREDKTLVARQAGFKAGN